MVAPDSLLQINAVSITGLFIFFTLSSFTSPINNENRVNDITIISDNYDELIDRYNESLDITNSLQKSILSYNDMLEDLDPGLQEEIGMNLSFVNNIEKELATLENNQLESVKDYQQDAKSSVRSLQEIDDIILSSYNIMGKLSIYLFIVPAILVFSVSSIFIILDRDFKFAKFSTIIGFIIIIFIPLYGNISQIWEAFQLTSVMENYNYKNNQYAQLIKNHTAAIGLIEDRIASISSEFIRYSGNTSNNLFNATEKINVLSNSS